MIAKVDGTFEMSGQFAIASPDGAIRETLERFAVTAPMQDNTPAAVAQATGAAIDKLSDLVIKKLRR
jgi:ABC-type uncharacterized transport system auxiliary subunit